MGWAWIFVFFCLMPVSCLAIWLAGKAFTHWIEPWLDRWMDR